MIEIKCYKLKTPCFNYEFLSGANVSSREWETECFTTEAEAIEALEIKKAKVRADTAWAKGWAEIFARDEHFTIEETTVTL